MPDLIMTFDPRQKLPCPPILSPISLGPHTQRSATPTTTPLRRQLATGSVTHHRFHGASPRWATLGDGSSAVEAQSAKPLAVPPTLNHDGIDEVPAQPSTYAAFADEDESVQAWSGGKVSREAPLMAVSRFVPRSSRLNTARADAIEPGLTLLLTHGGGFHKELFEPLLETLVERLRAQGIAVDEAWSLDMAGHGDSRQLASDGTLLGPFPTDAKDYMRDVLTFAVLYLPSVAGGELPELLLPDERSIQAIRKGTPVRTRTKLVSIGHSIGGETALGVTLHAPRLFTAVHAIEPIILDPETRSHGLAIPLARFALAKPPHMESVEVARKVAKKHPVWARYAPAVLEKHFEFGLEPARNAKAGAVALKSHPLAEAISYTDHQTVLQLSQRGRFFDASVPKLWMTGSKPLMYSPKAGPTEATVRRLAAQFAGMDVDVVEGGHNLPYDTPDLVAERLALFITNKLDRHPSPQL